MKPKKLNTLPETTKKLHQLLLANDPEGKQKGDSPNKKMKFSASYPESLICKSNLEIVGKFYKNCSVVYALQKSCLDSTSTMYFHDGRGARVMSLVEATC